MEDLYRGIQVGDKVTTGWGHFLNVGVVRAIYCGHATVEVGYWPFFDSIEGIPLGHLWRVKPEDSKYGT